MKTAMQEWFDELKANYPYMANEIYQKGFEKYLEKEKEQIKDAWDAGMSEGIGTMMADLDWDGEFVNYYKETYGE